MRMSSASISSLRMCRSILSARGDAAEEQRKIS
jgi:hypothetical protein